MISIFDAGHPLSSLSDQDKHCKTCKHWIQVWRGTVSGQRGTCDEIGRNWTEDQAYISDEAQLNTSPDFGCVLHEPKEKDSA